GTVREMAEWVEYLNSDGDSTVVKRRWANGRREPWHVKYWGVGNESWGCGGNMRPEYYADEYRRYQTFCRQYGDDKLFKIACGPSEDDYEWMEMLMQRAAKYMDAITLHYYTLCTGDWKHKGSATDFTVPDFYKTLVKASRMDEIVTGHCAIMDRYDPKKKVGLIVDEWGTWYDVEPGTNPGFLYQQNTMRDALVAALTLNIFNRHCDRVIMANLAQTVNVLQAVLLTEGDKMVLTPTYHVFDLYKAHQDAQEVDCFVQADTVGQDGWELPQVTASASVRDGVTTLTLANLSADKPATVTVKGTDATSIDGRILQGEMGQYNDFDASPLQVKAFDGCSLRDGEAVVELPPCCVAAIELK
ncbi:MAG: alpha-N-arabinofuranosidase, partial [Aristaeellaceae bacterium]